MESRETSAPRISRGPFHRRGDGPPLVGESRPCITSTVVTGLYDLNRNSSFSSGHSSRPLSSFTGTTVRQVCGVRFSPLVPDCRVPRPVVFRRSLTLDSRVRWRQAFGPGLFLGPFVFGYRFYLNEVTRSKIVTDVDFFSIYSSTSWSCNKRVGTRKNAQ